MTINLSQVDNNTTTPAGSQGGQGWGGGIANLNITSLTGVPDSGILTVNLSQVRDNSAGGLGGGILEDGVNPDDSLGPAGGQLTLKASQVTGNTAAEGGGIYASSGSPVALNLALVAGNVPGNCFPLGSIPGCTN
jgi:predicted outer membrane repeat protein